VVGVAVSYIQMIELLPHTACRWSQGALQFCVYKKIIICISLHNRDNISGFHLKDNFQYANYLLTIGTDVLLYYRMLFACL